jgi:hypothetical protein
VATHLLLLLLLLGLFGGAPTLQQVYSYQDWPFLFLFGAFCPVIFEENPAAQEKASPLPAQQSCPPFLPLGLVHLLGVHEVGFGQHLYSFQVLPWYGVVCPVILGMKPVLQVKGSPLPAQQSTPPSPLGLVHALVTQLVSLPGQHVYSL